MSEPAATAERGFWDRLPPRLRPLDAELPGAGNVRLIETTLLILIVLVLAVATVNDVVRQTGVNNRENVDKQTWRSYTGRYYHNVGVETDLFGITSTRDVVCGNTIPGAPDAKTQECLVVVGPIRAGRREVLGGWYVPPYVQHNDYAYRYGCFGSATKGYCAR
jgi:hypothetical protein